MLAHKLFQLLALAEAAHTAPSNSSPEPRSTKQELTKRDQGNFTTPQPIAANRTLPGVNYELIAKLRSAPNAIARIAMLEDSDFKFDYTNPPEIWSATLEGQGGTIVISFVATMPALVGNGMAMAVAFNKAWFNTPHTHPRATELSIVVKGRMVSEFVAETGARKIHNEHDTYSMVVFPQGSLHLEFNPDCTEMVFVAVFNNEDPGINTPGESIFMLDNDYAGLTLGLEFLPGADIDKYRKLVPPALAQGVDSCLAACGIAKNPVNGTQS